MLSDVKIKAVVYIALIAVGNSYALELTTLGHYTLMIGVNKWRRFKFA